MEIKVRRSDRHGNIIVLDLGKLWKQYEEKSYHAVFQQQQFEDKNGDYRFISDFQTSPLLNSWGNNEKTISESDALRGVHSRYGVSIKTLTYKGYETGDIPMKWSNEKYFCVIYNQNDREKCAKKEYGCDRDYTAEEMKKMFYDLCTDFGLTIEGDYLPDVVIDDGW